jgi:hypothetical protein
MAQDAFTAPCGCAWSGRRHDRACAAWSELVARRDRVREEANVDYGGLRTIEAQLYDHMPPWTVDGDLA